MKIPVIAVTLSATMSACGGGGGSPVPVPNPVGDAELKLLADDFAAAFVASLVAFEASLLPVLDLSVSSSAGDQKPCVSGDDDSGLAHRRPTGGIDLVDCILQVKYASDDIGLVSASAVTGNYSHWNSTTSSDGTTKIFNNATFQVDRKPIAGGWPQIGNYVATGSLYAQVLLSASDPTLMYARTGSSGGFPTRPAGQSFTAQFPQNTLAVSFQEPNHPACSLNLGAINGADRFAFSCIDLKVGQKRFSVTLKDFDAGNARGFVRFYANDQRNVEDSIEFSIDGDNVQVSGYTIGSIKATLQFSAPPLSESIRLYQ